MIRWIFAAAASTALVAAGVVHGFWTDRWSACADTAEAAARLETVPMVVGVGNGEWKGTEVEVKPGQVGAGVTGCIQRRYENKSTGQAVMIALVNGRPSFVATHTPEVCYGASGYLVGDKKAFRIDGDRSRFWTSVAERVGATDKTTVRLYWAWNGGAGWVAAGDARREFPRHRNSVLHKLYVLRDLSNLGPSRTVAKPSPAAEGDEVCESFLKVFVPELDHALFGKAG